MLPQELVYGFVREAPAPSTGHQSAVGEIFMCLRTHLTQHDSGRVWMSPTDIGLPPLEATPESILTFA